MYLLGLKWAKIVVLFQGNQLETFDLAYDDGFDWAVARVELFWESLAADKAPDWDGSDSTFQTVRLMHPEIIDDEVELGELGADLLIAQTDLDSSTEKLNLVKSKVLDKLGKAKYGLVGGNVVATRASRNGGTPYLSIKWKGQ